VFALVALLAIPGRASATVLTYVPGGSSGTNDLGDLDHHFYYAWTLDHISIPAGETITSAYLTFTNLYNWDSSKNVLYLDLLDQPSSGGTVLVSSSGAVSTPAGPLADTYNTTVRYASDPDVPAGVAPVTNFRDQFDLANALVSGAKTDLTEHAFLPDSGNPLNAAEINALRTVLTTDTSATTSPGVLPGTWADIGGATQPQWSVVQNGTGKYDYKYTFTAGQLANLSAYIGPASDPNRDITLAFDPDCHFFNDGVSFTIVTTSSAGGSSAVPEPASLMLLGTGLLLSVNQYRRRRTKKAAK